MVTHHEWGGNSHNIEEYYVERSVVETPPDLGKIVRSLMEKLQRFKEDNERFMREQESKTKINVVLLQILSDLQRQLQHGPMASNLDIHNINITQSPLEIQNHGPKNRNRRTSTSNKSQHGAKRHDDFKDSTEESSSKGTYKSKELSRSETILHSHRIRNMRKHSRSHEPEEFNK
jgi:hypothetical protein